MLKPCDCEPCRLVRDYLDRPSMTRRPTNADRFEHLRHIVRDRKEPAP